MSIPMFSGSRNPLEALLKILDHMVWAFGQGSHFELQNGCQAVILDHILACKHCRDTILVSMGMFSGSMNPLETLLTILGPLIWALGHGGHFEIQNGRQTVVILAFILACKPRRDMILVPMLIFSESMNHKKHCRQYWVI